MVHGALDCGVTSDDLVCRLPLERRIHVGHDRTAPVGVKGRSSTRSMQEPMHTSTGFQNPARLSWKGSLVAGRDYPGEPHWIQLEAKLSWDGSLRAGSDEGPWRPLPRRGPLNWVGQDEGQWRPLSRRGNSASPRQGPLDGAG